MCAEPLINIDTAPSGGHCWNASTNKTNGHAQNHVVSGYVQGKVSGMFLEKGGVLCFWIKIHAQQRTMIAGPTQAAVSWCLFEEALSLVWGQSHWASSQSEGSEATSCAHSWELAFSVSPSPFRYGMTSS